MISIGRRVVILIGKLELVVIMEGHYLGELDLYIPSRDNAGDVFYPGGAPVKICEERFRWFIFTEAIQ